MGPVAQNLGISWAEAGLTVLIAVAMYALLILLSRVFGARSFMTSTTYDLAFVFALGSLMGRVILVRTSLASAAIGLVTMFSLHAITGRLHHQMGRIHDVIQNAPILVVAHGRLLEELLPRAQVSRAEVHQTIRQHGYGAVSDVGAVIMERNGAFSVFGPDVRFEDNVLAEVIGRERLQRPQ